MSDQYTTDQAGETIDWGHPLLSQAETRALLSQAQAGDRDAESRLVECNARLVLHIADRYTGNGVDLQDLIQAGMVGLLSAIRKFDLSKRAPNGAPIAFSTYATWWVRQAVQRATLDTGATIRLPVHLAEKGGKIRRAAAELALDLGRDATTAEIAARCGYTRQAVEGTLTAARVSASLDAPTGDTADDPRPVTLGASVAAPEVVEETVMRSSLREAVRALVADLPDRQRVIVTLRFGLDRDGEPRTLEEVGAVLGVTRERIRQIEAKEIMPALRRAAREGGLLAYLTDGPAVIRMSDRETTAPAASRASA